jgi:hypothetical protein
VLWNIHKHEMLILKVGMSVSTWDERLETEPVESALVDRVLESARRIRFIGTT